MRYNDLLELRGIKDKMPISLNARSRELDRIMAQHGFTEISGACAFSTVYSYETNPNLVVKVFNVGKDGYRNFIDFCRSNPDNPALPKFKGRPIRITQEVSAIRIERLYLLTHEEWNTVAATVETIVRGDPQYSADDKNFNLYETLVELYHRGVSLFTLDWHDENFMKRHNGEIVITDPFSYKVRY